MKITLYTICWNEARMLDFFFDYYDNWIDNYIFYDDGSTDETLDILRRKPNVEIRQFPRSHKSSYVLSAQTLHNRIWKECKDTADWVVIIDVDEFIYHKNILGYLKESLDKGISFLPSIGFQMFSKEFPDPTDKLIDKVKTGMRFEKMDKPCIFNPKKIKQTRYSVGRHFAYPLGDVVYPEKNELLNLHFKYLSFQYVKERHKELNDKLGVVDIKKRFGHKYAFPEDKQYELYKELEENSSNVIDGFTPFPCIAPIPPSPFYKIILYKLYKKIFK